MWCLLPAATTVKSAVVASAIPVASYCASGPRRPAAAAAARSFWRPASVSFVTRRFGRAGPGKIAGTGPCVKMDPSPYTATVG